MIEKYNQKDMEKARLDGQIVESLESIKKEVHHINEKLDKNYVTKEELSTFKAELNPYILAIKSFLSMAVVAIVLAILKLVIK